MVKVGITAVERGSVRLLEQGAVCSSRLGTGPLMAARRTEEVLRAALGVPDRIPYAAKRAVRSALPGEADERAAETAELPARALALDGRPESLMVEPFWPVDHVGDFGPAGAPADVGEVTELVPGGAVSGELVAAAGPDLHLATGRGVVVLDARLMTGWGLVPRATVSEAGPTFPCGSSGGPSPVFRTGCSDACPTGGRSLPGRVGVDPSGTSG
jgi:hypothetical protein